MNEEVMIKELETQRDYKLHQVETIFSVAKKFFLSVVIVFFILGTILFISGCSQQNDYIDCLFSCINECVKEEGIYDRNIWQLNRTIKEIETVKDECREGCEKECREEGNE